MNKVMRPIAMLILHEAKEYIMCIQVDLKQGFQKGSFYREKPILAGAAGEGQISEARVCKVPYVALPGIQYYPRSRCNSTALSTTGSRRSAVLSSERLTGITFVSSRQDGAQSFQRPELIYNPSDLVLDPLRSVIKNRVSGSRGRRAPRRIATLGYPCRSWSQQLSVHPCYGLRAFSPASAATQARKDVFRVSWWPGGVVHDAGGCGVAPAPDRKRKCRARETRLVSTSRLLARDLLTSLAPLAGMIPPPPPSTLPSYLPRRSETLFSCSSLLSRPPPSASFRVHKCHLTLPKVPKTSKHNSCAPRRQTFTILEDVKLVGNVRPGQQEPATPRSAPLMPDKFSSDVAARGQHTAPGKSFVIPPCRRRQDDVVALLVSWPPSCAYLLPQFGTGRAARGDPRTALHELRAADVSRLDPAKEEWSGVERIRWFLKHEVLKADGCEMRVIWSSARMQGRRKRESPEITCQPATSSGAIPSCENPDEPRQGSNPIRLVQFAVVGSEWFVHCATMGPYLDISDLLGQDPVLRCVEICFDNTTFVTGKRLFATHTAEKLNVHNYTHTKALVRLFATENLQRRDRMKRDSNPPIQRIFNHCQNESSLIWHWTDRRMTKAGRRPYQTLTLTQSNFERASAGSLMPAPVPQRCVGSIGLADATDLSFAVFFVTVFPLYLDTKDGDSPVTSPHIGILRTGSAPEQQTNSGAGHEECCLDVNTFPTRPLGQSIRSRLQHSAVEGLHKSPQFGPRKLASPLHPVTGWLHASSHLRAYLTRDSILNYGTRGNGFVEGHGRVANATSPPTLPPHHTTVRGWRHRAGLNYLPSFSTIVARQRSSLDLRSPSYGTRAQPSGTAKTPHIGDAGTELTSHGSVVRREQYSGLPLESLLAEMLRLRRKRYCSVPLPALVQQIETSWDVIPLLNTVFSAQETGTTIMHIFRHLLNMLETKHHVNELRISSPCHRALSTYYPAGFRAEESLSPAAHCYSLGATLGSSLCNADPALLIPSPTSLGPRLRTNAGSSAASAASSPSFENSGGIGIQTNSAASSPSFENSGGIGIHTNSAASPPSFENSGGIGIQTNSGSVVYKEGTTFIYKKPYCFMRRGKHVNKHSRGKEEIEEEKEEEEESQNEWRSLWQNQ
ncbi:hypothetical protein PR048_014463 [Dryococelus australis]|uniref:Uncharacterized protein n=1 Tax=Dryococelus australis TaxID=614101 RepID=A0ABQ9HEP4_9NEOP|nr:hypothetical protein PR048_014463 [Dryococelus australis]